MLLLIYRLVAKGLITPLHKEAHTLHVLGFGMEKDKTFVTCLSV